MNLTWKLCLFGIFFLSTMIHFSGSKPLVSIWHRRGSAASSGICRSAADWVWDKEVSQPAMWGSNVYKPIDVVEQYWTTTVSLYLQSCLQVPDHSSHQCTLWEAVQHCRTSFEWKKVQSKRRNSRSPNLPPWKFILNHFCQNISRIETNCNWNVNLCLNYTWILV